MSCHKYARPGEILAWGLAVLLLGACSAPGPGISSRGFASPRLGYEIHYSQRDSRQFIDFDWQVDNYFRDNGENWKQKRGANYYGSIVRVKDRDEGVEKRQGYFFDLKLVHSKTNGVIWIQTFPLHPKHRHKLLDVLMANYAESLSGTGLYLAGDVYGLLQVKEKRYAATIKSKRPIKVGPYPGLLAMIDLVNLDRVKVDPGSSSNRLALVITRFWFTDEVTRAIGAHFVVTKVNRHAIMIAGYQNTPEYFERHLPDFDSFVRQIRFSQHPMIGRDTRELPRP